MRKILLTISILLLAAMACQFGSAESNDGKAGSSQTGQNGFPAYQMAMKAEPANLGQLEMQLGQLGPFSGRFSLEFNGKENWTYQVDIRSDGSKIEYSLTIAGIDGDQNPGDVRLVNSEGNNFMRGPGTGDFCIRFPDSFETERLFFWPTDFVHLDAFASPPAEIGTNRVAGQNATRYHATEDSHLGWREINVDYWVDPDTGATLKYEFAAWGSDPLYGKGEGRIRGVFEVLEIGPQKVNPVEDCRLGFQVPMDAREIIRLPGIINFTSSLGPGRLDNFYKELLEPAGWTRAEPKINSATRNGVLEYSKNGRTVTIHVSAINTANFDEGFIIEIFLDE